MMAENVPEFPRYSPSETDTTEPSSKAELSALLYDASVKHLKLSNFGNKDEGDSRKFSI